MARATSFRLDWVSDDTSLDLYGADGGSGSYSFEVLADGFEPGSPEAAKEVTSALFLDGDHTIATRDGNVVKAFLVRITGSSSDGLAAGEAALDLMRGRRGSQVRWRPHDGIGATSVRQVMVADLAQQPDDLDEVLRNRRTVRVSLECLPHVYSVGEESFTLGDGIESIANVASMTGWTVIDGSASIVGGRVTTAGSATLEFTPSANLDEYLYLDVDPESGGLISEVTVGGVSIPPARWQYLSAARKFITIPVGRARGSRAKVRFTSFNAVAVYAAETRSFPPPGPGEDSPIVVFDAVGTRRTPALVRIYNESADLGDVFVYAAPDPNRSLWDGVSWDVFGTVGVAEVVGHEGEGGFTTVAGTPKRFGVGTTHEDLGQTKPQAAFTGRQLWQPDTTVDTTGNVNTVTVGTTYAYPDDRDAKVTFIAGVAAKCLFLVPRTPAYPSGGVFIGDDPDGSDAEPYTLQEGDLFDPPAVFPDRSGMQATAENGGVVTVTYTPAWPFNAGR